MTKSDKIGKGSDATKRSASDDIDAGDDDDCVNCTQTIPFAVVIRNSTPITIGYAPGPRPAMGNLSVPPLANQPAGRLTSQAASLPAGYPAGQTLSAQGGHLLPLPSANAPLERLLQAVNGNQLGALPSYDPLQAISQPVVRNLPGTLPPALVSQPALPPSPRDVEKEAEKEAGEQAQKAVKVFQALARPGSMT